MAGISGSRSQARRLGPGGHRSPGSRGLRRSEASALTWADVELWPDGTGRVTI